MTTWADEYLIMVDDYEKREDRLTEWEIMFLGSLRNRLKQNLTLSLKQTETLDRIWERAHLR